MNDPKSVNDLNSVNDQAQPDGARSGKTRATSGTQTRKRKRTRSEAGSESETISKVVSESERDGEGDGDGDGEGFLRRFRWPLTAQILSINLLVLIIPLYGFVRVDTVRSSLIEAELASMEAEGRIVAKALGATADRVPSDFANFRNGRSLEGVTRLSRTTIAQLGGASRSTLQLLSSDFDSRMRLFDLNGDVIADTDFLGAGVNPVRVESLGGPSNPRSSRFFLSRWIARLFGGQTFELYSEPPIDSAGNYAVSMVNYEGESGSDVQMDADGGLVFLVGVPVSEYRRVIGSLLISRDETGVEASVQQLQSEVVRVTFITLGVTILLSILLASTIARPIRRLAINAIGVAQSKRRQVQIPDLRYRRDEIGDLSFATRRMTEALWDRLDATDAFAADVSHELKNPLTSLKSAVETMSAYPDSPRRGELLDIVMHDVERMDRLITDISKSSRVDAEISRQTWQRIDLADVTQGLITARQATARGDRDSDAAPAGAAAAAAAAAADGNGDGSANADGGNGEAAERAVTFDLVVPKQLAKGGTAIQAVGDRIAQVLINLMDNAETFSPPGGKVLIRFAKAKGKRLRVEVIDQGPGIPADRLARVFDRFYTDRPESDGFGNHSGLGLSIVRQIVEGHRGKIWADNADDQDEARGYGGAKFVFELPLAGRETG